MYYQKAFHMKVKILNNIAKTGLDILEKEGFALHQNDDFDGCSGIVLRSQNLTQEKLPKSILVSPELEQELTILM